MTRSKKGGRKGKRASLLSPDAMGGIVAGNGFDFQTRYVACHLPLWLQQGEFQQLLHEGTGDVDLLFSGGVHSGRLHIQVKDHEVSPGELREVVEQFAKTDSQMPGVYGRFTLACPTLAVSLRPVERALARFRGAKPFYEDVPSALASTQDEVDQRLRRTGLARYREFVRSKVFLDVGHGDLHHDDRAIDLFISRLLSHPDYAGKVRSMVQPAFAALMRTVAARRGVALTKSEVETILRDAVREGLGREEPSVVLWIQNWTNEQFELPADYVLDWSVHFDRSTRRVPSEDTWNLTLLPALAALRNEIAARKRERLVRFRGKCALSTGVALGASFPTVGGWTFEVIQPTSAEPWRSDAAPTAPFSIETEVTVADSVAADLVLGLNLKGDARSAITQHLATTGLRPKIVAFAGAVKPGLQGLGGPADATAFALAVRDLLGELQQKHGTNRTHLFLFGPLALAIFLGQHLTAVGEVQLYEYQEPGYVPSCRLRT